MGERYTIGLESLGTRYRKYRNDGAKGERDWIGGRMGEGARNIGFETGTVERDKIAEAMRRER